MGGHQLTLVAAYYFLLPIGTLSSTFSGVGAKFRAELRKHPLTHPFIHQYTEKYSSSYSTFA